MIADLISEPDDSAGPPVLAEPGAQLLAVASWILQSTRTILNCALQPSHPNWSAETSHTKQHKLLRPGNGLHHAELRLKQEIDVITEAQLDRNGALRASFPGHPTGNQTWGDATSDRVAGA